MDSRNMQVIGLCRFSYPALGGFQVEHDTPEERAAFLYAPDRMESRLRTFETFTLPPLRAQSDQDFLFGVVIGEDLPDRWRDRLEALLEREQSANPKEYLMAMRDLEMAISDLSGNQPLALFAQVLSRMAMNYPLGELPKGVIGPLSEAHEKSVRAIAAGEAGLARRAVSQYLELLSDCYRPEVRDKWPANVRKF